MSSTEDMLKISSSANFVDFPSPAITNVGCHVLVRGVGQQTGQDVALKEVIVGVHCLKHYLSAWQLASGFNVVVYLVVEAAL